MEISVNDILKGKPLIIKNKEYLSAAAYIEPFLDRMSKFTNDFRIQAVPADVLSRTEDGGIVNDAYSRVWIQAVLPDECSFNNHQEVIGMVYGLDIRKPVVKMYKGALNMACLNLCVFNPDMLDVQGLEPETPINFKPINHIMDMTSDICGWLRKIESVEVSYNEVEINERLGHWVRGTINNSYDNGFGKVKIASSTAIDAYKLLYEKKDSSYYVQPGESTSMFNVYNAFTELISNDGTVKDRQGGDIVNKCEKTLLIKDILGLI